MPTIELRGDPRDWAFVWAVMHFPREEELRDRMFLIESVANGIQELPDDARYAPDVGTVRALVDAAKYGDVAIARAAAAKKTALVADLLTILYLMHKEGVTEPSFNKAIEAFSKYAPRHKSDDGSAVPSSEKMLRINWKLYESVAHFWAAMRLHGTLRELPLSKASPETFVSFLRIAQKFYSFASTFVPLRARPPVPLIDAADAWQLPSGIEPFEGELSYQAPNIMKIIKRYRAARSR